MHNARRACPIKQHNEILLYTTLACLGFKKLLYLQHIIAFREQKNVVISYYDICNFGKLPIFSIPIRVIFGFCHLISQLTGTLDKDWLNLLDLFKNPTKQFLKHPQSQ